MMDAARPPTPAHSMPFEDQHTALLETLKTTFDMADEDAEAIAEVVLDAFGGGAEVLDEHLETDVRSIFYTLEAKRILGFRREDHVRETGARARAFYWFLREETLAATRRHHHVHASPDVYDSLPAAAWVRQAA